MTAPEHDQRPWITRAPGLAANFMLHCATGLIAVLVHYSLMYLALGIGVSALGATSVGFIGGALSRFLMAYHHVFAPSRPRNVAMLHFVVSLLIQFLLNAVAIASLLALGLGIWPAQIAATVVLTFINYAMYKLWVFA